jgi:hypothetical protein
MEPPKLKIPKSFFDNFDTVVKYQNVQLIKAICEFKGWGAEREDEITRCFFNGELPEKQIKPSKVVTEKVVTEKSKTKRLVRKKAINKKEDIEKIVYIQKPIEIEGIKYIIEDPTNNIYSVEKNEFIGIYYIDNGGLGKINTRLQEN